MSSAMRFSKPSPRWLENGKLLGSAQTRSSRSAAVACCVMNKMSSASVADKKLSGERNPPCCFEFGVFTFQFSARNQKRQTRHVRLGAAQISGKRKYIKSASLRRMLG